MISLELNPAEMTRFYHLTRFDHLRHATWSFEALRLLLLLSASVCYLLLCVVCYCVLSGSVCCFLACRFLVCVVWQCVLSGSVCCLLCVVLVVSSESAIVRDRKRRRGLGLG